MVEIDATTLNQFFQALTVLILALIAWWNKQRTDSAATTAAATTQTAASNAAMAALPVAAPAPKPVLMSEATKAWLVSDATPENKAAILKQIAAAEAAGLNRYTITFPTGYYLIENGIQYGAAGNAAGK
jgi:hypothetical protein